MHIEWNIPVGTIILVGIQFLAGIIGMMRAFAAIEKSIDSRFNEMKLTVAGLKEGDMRELQGRISRLETGADEWTKTLRERTHEHTNQINVLMLDIDRLKRPERYRRAEDHAGD